MGTLPCSGRRGAAAVSGLRGRRADRTLLVHCEAGISRSNTIIATTIACEEDRRLLDAFDLVRAARPHAVAHPRLHELAVYYVGACEDRDLSTNASAASG